jgi:Flp pilus assembly protein TadD
MINTDNTLVTARYRVITAVILAVVVLIVYWQCVHHTFIIYDDPDYVTENIHVREGVTLHNVAWAFTTFTASNWHPLAWLSHMLDVQLFGLDPGMHHLVNVLLHIANTLLLLYLLWRLTGDWRRGLFVAALFALHPLHAESVAWVAERKDVLSTFLMLITLTLYGRYAVSWRPLTYILTLASFALGLLAKPMLVTLPLILLLLDYWPLKRLRLPGQPDKSGVSAVSLWRLLIEKIPFLALTLGSCMITYLAQQRGGAMAVVGTMPLSFRVINALVSYIGYLKKMLWPVDLVMIYPLPLTLTLVQGVAAGLVLSGISALVWRYMQRCPYLVTGWLWYLVTLVPVIGLVQVGQQAMADRYSYIPLIGVFIMIAWGVPFLVERRPFLRAALPVTAVVVVGVLSVCTWLQLGFWKNSVTLFRHASTAVHGNIIACRILGVSLAQQGRFADAERAFTEALRIRPDDQETHNAWGDAMAQQKRFADAESHYATALRIDPEYATAHFNLGKLLAEEGRLSEAIGHYLIALRLQPGQPDIYLYMGSTYARGGDFTNALSCYQKALALDPENADILYSMGLAYAMQGNIEECITWLNRALAERPEFAEAHYNLGVALARTGRMEEGIRHFDEALRINPGLKEARKALETALRRKAG